MELGLKDGELGLDRLGVGVAKGGAVCCIRA